MSIELIGDGISASVSVGLYSDATPMIKTGEGFDPTVFHTMVLRHETTTEFVAAMFLVDSLGAQNGWIENLILPYIPGARQDRINPTGDNLFAAFSFADMINARHFSKVIVLDPHSPVAPRCINRVTEYPLSEVAHQIDSKGYDGIIAPDKGAKDRAEIFAAAMGKPIYYASKNRDVSTGRLSGFSVDVPFGHYLVVDDICDGGGTFVGLGEKITEQGSTADLYVTHGIFSKGTDGLKSFYNNIYTTDSRSFHERNDVTVIPVVERMKNYA